jgi:hypothetical protein
MIASEPAPDPAGSSVAAPTVPVVAAEPRTRLQKGIRRPKIYTDGTVRYGMFTSTGEPSNLTEALSDPHWKHSMDEEHAAL